MDQPHLPGLRTPGAGLSEVFELDSKLVQRLPQVRQFTLQPVQFPAVVPVLRGAGVSLVPSAVTVAAPQIVTDSFTEVVFDVPCAIQAAVEEVLGVVDNVAHEPGQAGTTASAMTIAHQVTCFLAKLSRGSGGRAGTCAVLEHGSLWPGAVYAILGGIPGADTKAKRQSVSIHGYRGSRFGSRRMVRSPEASRHAPWYAARARAGERPVDGVHAGRYARSERSCTGGAGMLPPGVSCVY